MPFWMKFILVAKGKNFMFGHKGRSFAVAVIRWGRDMSVGVWHISGGDISRDQKSHQA